jgi:uncharacterized protein YybS (DUF2232 family)
MLHDFRQKERRQGKKQQGYRGDGLTTGEKTGTLAQGAFFTALFVVIGLAGMYLPALYLFTAMLLPLPLMLLVLKANTRCGIIGLAAAGLLLINLVTPEAAFALVF